VGQLTLAEAALLAGLPKAPSTYSPFNDAKRAKVRRDYVLERMEKEGHISAAQAKAAIRQPIALKPFFQERGMAPSFVDFIRKELEPRFGQVLLAKGGLRIHTTLNLKMQQTAMEVLHRGIAEIERTQVGRRKEAAPEAPALEGALVALDPATGEIRAMVGGRDYARSQWNRAVQARRQPGSAFKPFVYATAFERGFTPASLLEDFPVSYSIRQNGRMVEWSPENFDRQFRGEVTLRRALEESINVPTVRLLEAVGVDPVIFLAHRMGVASELRREYGLALGVSEVSLLELTSAYGVFANRGIRVPPRGVRKVVAPNGDVLEITEEPGERILREEVAFLVTSLLQGAVERGTAKRAKIPGYGLAAKTGTSQDAADIWFVGYTARLAAGLWIGFDQLRSLGSHESAGRLGAPVWAEFMQRVLPEIPAETIPIPEGVFPAQVNWRTGFPTGPEDPEAITEFFIRGDIVTPEAERAAPPPEAPAPPELVPATPPIVSPSPSPNDVGQR
jgi:penicillin-binding protein 1A